MKKKTLRYCLLTFLFVLMMAAGAQAATHKGLVRVSENPTRYCYYKNGRKLTSRWKKVDNYYYYFDKNGRSVTGYAVKIDGKYYYFDNSRLLTGKLRMVRRRNRRYLIGRNGIGVRGLKVYYKKAIYCTDKKGKILAGAKMKEGLVKVGKYYCFISNSRLVKSSWRTWRRKKYYFDSTGRAVTGPTKVDGVMYVFGASGQLKKVKSDKFVRVAGKRYYVNRSGEPVTGWVRVDGKLYYILSDGQPAVNTTIDGVTFGSDGVAVEDDVNTLVTLKAMAIMDQISNPSDPMYVKLRKAWNYITGGSFRYAGIYPDMKAGWQRRLAYSMLTGHCGNCYGFACGFAALARAIGYQPKVVNGLCPGTRDGRADGLTRHSWVIIDGRHYDPEAQYAGWSRGIYGAGQTFTIVSVVDF